jgi:ABC-type phosphate transport system permease subunit
MIVYLVLSQGNHLTIALMGPGGLGSIAAEITANFDTASHISQSGLILLGLILFGTTLAINIMARLVVERSSGSGL